MSNRTTIMTIPNHKVISDQITLRGDFSEKTIEAILAGQYPELEFSLAARTPFSRSGGIVDRALRRISENRENWLRNLVAAAGGSPRAAWLGLRGRGYVATQWEGEELVFCAPFGSGPLDFFQVVIEVAGEQTAGPLTEDESPVDLDDLLHPLHISQETAVLIEPRQLSGVSVENVSRFFREKETAELKRRQAELPALREKTVRMMECDPQTGHAEEVDVPFLAMFPEYLSAPSPHMRWAKDWQMSSPGRGGQVLCRRWFFDLTRSRGAQGEDVYGWCVPRPIWNGRDRPEQYRVQDGTPPWVVLEALRHFDQQAGYPFAWYFHMVFGDLVPPLAGEIVAGGLRHGEIELPAHDAEVLLGWADCPYGF